MSGAVVYLAWHELKSNLRPARVVPPFSLAMLVCFMVVRQPWDSSMTYLQGALSLFGKSWLPYMIPLAAAAMGSSLAADRRNGLTLAILARGVSRDQYLLAKILGAATSVALLIMAEIIGFYLMAGMVWPTGVVTWEGTDFYPGPVPALFAVNPLANDLLGGTISVLAAMVLALVGVLAGTLVTNEYIAMATPPLFVILSALFLRGPLGLLSPQVHLNVWSGYAGTIPAEMHLYAAFGYWLGLSTVVIGLSRWIFARKELG